MMQCLVVRASCCGLGTTRAMRAAPLAGSRLLLGLRPAFSYTHTHTPVKEKVVEGKERGSWAIAEMGRKLGWLLVDGIG